MSEPPADDQHAGEGRPAGSTPVVPPLPSKAQFGRRRTRSKGWISLVALGVGIALGVGAYQLSEVAFYFDYWVALILN